MSVNIEVINVDFSILLPCKTIVKLALTRTPYFSKDDEDTY